MSDNIATVRKGFAAFATGDMDTLREVFDRDIEWHLPGRSTISGDYQGIDAVLAFFGTLFQISGGTFKAELIECGELTSDLVACLIHRSGKMAAGTVDQRTMLLFQMRDGRAVEVTEFAHDLYAYDEAVGARAIALPDARKAEVPVTT
jgi:ketosteroid isomerase-like protein